MTYSWCRKNDLSFFPLMYALRTSFDENSTGFFLFYCLRLSRDYSQTSSMEVNNYFLWGNWLTIKFYCSSRIMSWEFLNMSKLFEQNTINSWFISKDFPLFPPVIQIDLVDNFWKQFEKIKQTVKQFFVFCGFYVRLSFLSKMFYFYSELSKWF